MNAEEKTVMAEPNTALMWNISFSKLDSTFGWNLKKRSLNQNWIKLSLFSASKWIFSRKIPTKTTACPLWDNIQSSYLDIYPKRFHEWKVHSSQKIKKRFLSLSSLIEWRFLFEFQLILRPPVNLYGQNVLKNQFDRFLVGGHETEIMAICTRRVNGPWISRVIYAEWREK